MFFGGLRIVASKWLCAKRSIDAFIMIHSVLWELQDGMLAIEIESDHKDYVVRHQASSRFVDTIDSSDSQRSGM